jgi:hypothetical protein
MLVSKSAVLEDIMSRLRRHPASFAAVTLCLILTLALTGCEDTDWFMDGPLIPEGPEIKVVTIVPDVLVLSDGQRDSLEAIVVSVDGDTLTRPLVTWRSRNTGVATLFPGVGPATEVYGLAPGEALVTAEYDGKIDTAQVVVN